MNIVKVKLLEIVNMSVEEIVEKTNNFFKFPVVSGCCNQFLPECDFLPVLVEDESGNQYFTLFCKECSMKINEWFEVLEKSLVERY